MVDSLWIEKNGVVFVYRAAGLIIDGERVLLGRKGKKKSWSPPGGKVKMGEDSEAALRRILSVELGQEVEVERLVWVVENHTEEEGQRCHEIALYYLARLAANSTWLTGSGPFVVTHAVTGEKPQKTELCWFPIDPAQRPNEAVKPKFLDQAFSQLAKSSRASGKMGTNIWGVSGTIKIKA